MAFGVGDVCTRANGRGEQGGDVAARRRRGSVPRAFCQLFQPLSPSALMGRRRRTTHGGYVVVSGRWRGLTTRRGWRTGWGAVFMLLIDSSSRHVREN